MKTNCNRFRNESMDWIGKVYFNQKFAGVYGNIH